MRGIVPPAVLIVLFCLIAPACSSMPTLSPAQLSSLAVSEVT
jgi:hypothetical protein